MEEKSSYLGNWNDTLQYPEEDVAISQNKSSSEDSKRLVDSHGTLAQPNTFNRTKKPSSTVPFICPSLGNEHASAEGCGDITSPRPMSMEPQRSKASNLSSHPLEDVAISKNQSLSEDSKRIVNNHEALAHLDTFKRTKESSLTVPFGVQTFGNNQVSAEGYGDIASPRPMSMEPRRSESGSSVIGQASIADKSQLVMSDFMCFWKGCYQPSMANAYLKQALRLTTGKYNHHSTEIFGSEGPYFNRDGTFKDFDQLRSVNPGIVIYGRTEKVYTIEIGVCFGRNLYFSKCNGYVLKRRPFSKRILDAWKLLSDNEHVMPLTGVIMADQGLVYQVTECMQVDLRQARKQVTLIQLAAIQDNKRWSQTWRNFSNIMRSVLQGIIHLNKHGNQHYDIKEDNIFVKMPHGCTCASILECTCEGLAEIRIGDFDTLSTIAGPKHRTCGTKFYRPPESESRTSSLTYEHPTRDSWSLVVILLHFCCGTAMTESDTEMKEMPWLKNQECHYAKNRLLKVFCSCGPRLQPVALFAAKCLETDYKKRPTPQEILKHWDAICV